MARPRKSGPRTPSGRLSRAYKGPCQDNGTPELQAKRTAMVGSADPSLSSTVPGILFAHRHLDRDQYTEALEYRRLRCALYGPPWPYAESATNYGYQAWRGTDAVGYLDDPDLKRLKARFDAKVRGLTTEQKHVVTDVCVFDRLPNWFFVDRLGVHELPEDKAERAILVEGLNRMLRAAPPPSSTREA